MADTAVNVPEPDEAPDGYTLQPVATNLVGGLRYQVIKLTYGELDTVEGGHVALDNGFPVQPATGSVWSFNLPTGASTATLQGTGNTSLASILTTLGSQATAALQGTGNTALGNILTALGSQATAALQGTGNTLLTAIGSALVGTLTVQGTVGVNSLPSGLATSALQGDTNTAIALTARESGGNLAALVAKDYATSAKQDTLATAVALIARESGGNLAGINAKLVAGTTIGKVEIAASQTVGLAAGAAVIGHVIVDSGTVTTTLGAGSNVLGRVGIDLTTPGTTNLVEAKTNVRRNGGALHRNAITAADRLASPGTVTMTSQSLTGGTLSTSTTYYGAYVARNAMGVTVASGISNVGTAANTGIRMALPQVANATHYDLFLSTSSTGPLWVVSITEAQRAAGGSCVAVGTYSASFGTAGAIDVGIVGNQQASSAASFGQNTAYYLTGITPIDCTGRSLARVKIQMAVTDWRSAITLNVVPMWADQIATGVYFAGKPLDIDIGTRPGAALSQDVYLPVDGATGLILAVDSLTGQGAAVSIWVELI